MIKIGDRFFDDKNGRYLTVDGVVCDPKCYSCIQEEPDENDPDDIIVTGKILMMRGELEKMIKY